MRWGLIARPETARGLGVQTQDMAHWLKPDKVLTIWMPDSGDYATTQIDGLNLFWDHKFLGNGLPLALEWAKDLDVVLSVETFYDVAFERMLREAGKKTVILGNPEFHRPDLFKPTEYWWPTEWLRNKITRGRLMPMPSTAPWEAPLSVPFDGSIPLEVLHVVGRPALGDRNGTQLLLEALQFIQGDVNVTITALGSSPVLDAAFDGRFNIPENVKLDVITEGTEDRWSLYEGKHLLVMPRRYAGLCLPVLEAMSCGLAVMMPECSPNSMWPAKLLPATKTGQVPMPVGHVPIYSTSSAMIGRSLSGFMAKPDTLARLQERSLQWASVNTWDKRAADWLGALEEVAAS